MLVESLALSSLVSAPFHEELDLYHLERARRSGEPVHMTFERVLSGGLTEAVRGKKSFLVAKWRPFLFPRTRLAKQKELMRDFKPTVLARTSLVIQAAKICLNELEFDTRWPQFMAQKMTLQNYENKIKRVSNQKFKITEELAARIIRETESLLRREQRMLRSLEVIFGEAPKTVIFTEEFLRPKLDLEALENVGRKILQSTEWKLENYEKQSLVQTRKMGIEPEQMQGLEDLLSSDWALSIPIRRAPIIRRSLEASRSAN